jgi:hypothetical protein
MAGLSSEERTDSPPEAREGIVLRPRWMWIVFTALALGVPVLAALLERKP